MKHHTTGIPTQKLLALILMAALSSACAALDSRSGVKPDDGGNPGGNATPYLPIDGKLAAELKDKNVKMLVALDKDGKLIVMNEHGVIIQPCGEECSGLKDVTVRAIENPVILKTTRNPTCAIWVVNGQARQVCW